VPALTTGGCSSTRRAVTAGRGDQRADSQLCLVALDSPIKASTCRPPRRTMQAVAERRVGDCGPTEDAFR
jgi:hypothetical protein